MLGFHFSLYRIVGEAPRDVEALASRSDKQSVIDSLQLGERIAVWQTGPGGTDWVRELVAQGRAYGDLGTGYPGLFFARAGDVLETIVNGPPAARLHWQHDPGDIIDRDLWAGRTVINEEAADGRDPTEWLVLVVWDES